MILYRVTSNGRESYCLVYGETPKDRGLAKVEKLWEVPPELEGRTLDEIQARYYEWREYVRGVPIGEVPKPAPTPTTAPNPGAAVAALIDRELDAAVTRVLATRGRENP